MEFNLAVVPRAKAEIVAAAARKILQSDKAGRRRLYQKLGRLEELHRQIEAPMLRREFLTTLAAAPAIAQTAGSGEGRIMPCPRTHPARRCRHDASS